jgi:PAS domain S-box-containing protein
VQDITEREERHQRMVEALAASEERARLAFERAADAMLLLDREATITQANDQAAVLTGRPLADLVGRKLSTLFSKEQLRRTPFQVEQVRAGETVVSERRLLRADGAEVPVEMSSRRLVDGLAQAIIRDLTERRRLEEQLLQARKLEAVGRLAAGVAHDFNNLLVVILSGCDYLRDEPLSVEQREEVEQIRGAGARAANLVSQLLTFSRKGRSNPVRTDLNAAVSRIEKLLRRTIGEDVALEVVQGAEPWPIEIDPTHLDQVLMNLAVNARDAMPDGGWLRIETRNEVLRVERGDGPAVRFASLVVSDGGAGIAPEVKPHIFEPFFTTKPGGEGTGLGLSTIFGIVHQAGGRIGVESEPGRGTTFRLSFPIAADAAAEATPEPDRGEAAPAGETVLVVEDDDGVRRSVVRMLESCGFRVLQAANGHEALDRARGARLDVALVDVVMPAMPGSELAERLREVQPDVVVAFQSGYADQKSQRLPPGAPFIQKPFTADALMRFLLASLRGGRGRGVP